MREAGALALKTFRGSIKQWAKGQSSLVCEADLAVDALAARAAGRRAAGLRLAVGGNRGRSGAACSASAVWIVDPIDGTRSYLAGRDDWAVSAALAVDGRPVAGGAVCAGHR